ncbi:MAG: DegT/DnrJ/EryC1/StrS family aminotransferase, partial [Polyangiales bacterium]
AGLRPVFVECDEDLHLDLTDLARKLTDDVRAVVAVHMRGFACDVDALRRLTDPRAIPVVEDAVPGLGAKLRGRHLGTLGVAGAFSTQSDKSLNTGEGGFVVTQSSALFARAAVYSGAYEGRMARHFEPEEPPAEVVDTHYPIFGWRMDEIRAALARSMLRRLDQRVARHRRNYRAVAEPLAKLTRLAVREPVAPDALLGESLLFRLPDSRPGAAAGFARALRAEGITCRNVGDADDRNARAFWNWGFCFPSADVARRALPRTAATLEQTLDVPLSANLTEADCAELVRAITKVAEATEQRC